MRHEKRSTDSDTDAGNTIKMLSPPISHGEIHEETDIQSKLDGVLAKVIVVLKNGKQ